MAKTSKSIHHLAQDLELSGDMRILVLEDVAHNLRPVWGVFRYPYDRSEQLSVASLFDASYTLLRDTREDHVFTEVDLPIVSIIGSLRMTGIRRLSADTCVTFDLERSTGNDLIGLG